jgi:hypothetical protein
VIDGDVRQVTVGGLHRSLLFLPTTEGFPRHAVEAAPGPWRHGRFLGTTHATTPPEPGVAESLTAGQRRRTGEAFAWARTEFGLPRDYRFTRSHAGERGQARRPVRGDPAGRRRRLRGAPHPRGRGGPRRARPGGGRRGCGHDRGSAYGLERRLRRVARGGGGHGGPGGPGGRRTPARAHRAGCGPARRRSAPGAEGARISPPARGGRTSTPVSRRCGTACASWRTTSPTSTPRR